MRPGAENRPGPNACKRPVTAGPTQEERILGAKIRAWYQHERSTFESMRTGKNVVWRIPGVYDGKGRAGVEVGSKPPPPAVWSLLARWFIVNIVDPQDYIRWVFERVGFGRAPEPNRILSNTSLDDYRAMLKETNETVRSALFTQVSAMDTYKHQYMTRFGFTDKDALLSLMVSRTVSLSPLFRYCLGHDVYLKTAINQFLELAKGYEIDAVFQFMQRRDSYLEHWGKWLPIGFDKTARRIYDRLMFNEEEDS